MKHTPILIVGTKTLSVMIHDLCAHISVPIRGFIDDEIRSRTFMNTPIVGSVNSILKRKEYWRKYGIVVGIGDNINRKRISELFIKSGFVLPTLVDSNCTIALTSKIEDGCIIFAFSYLGTNVQIQKGTVILPHVTLTHDDIVGEYSFISSGATLAGRVQIGPLEKINIGTIIGHDTIIRNVNISK